MNVCKRLIQLLVDKDTMTSALTTSHDVHLQRIDAREDDITTAVRQWLTTVIDDLHDREELRRNRTRVIEINNLIDHLRDDVENVELVTRE